MQLQAQFIAEKYLNELYFTSEELEVINKNLQEVSSDWHIKECQISISQKKYLLQSPLPQLIKELSSANRKKWNSSDKINHDNFFNIKEELTIGKIENGSFRQYRVFYADKKGKFPFLVVIGPTFNHTVAFIYKLDLQNIYKVDVYPTVKTDEINKLVPINRAYLSYFKNQSIVYEDETTALEIKLWTLVAQEKIARDLVFPDETHLQDWCYEETTKKNPWRFQIYSCYIDNVLVRFTGGALKNYYGTKSYEIEFDATFDLETGELIIVDFTRGIYSP